MFGIQSKHVGFICVHAEITFNNKGRIFSYYMTSLSLTTAVAYKCCNIDNTWLNKILVYPVVNLNSTETALSFATQGQ